MEIDQIIEYLTELGGVLTLTPQPGDGSPEISWGDTFFYYAPDGVIPRTQPFATIVTKNYPDDERSRLDRPDTFRLNLFAGKPAFTAWTGHPPRDAATATAATTDAAATTADPGATDTIFAHPVYGPQGWLAVVNPGPRTQAAVRELLRTAHDLARSRYRPSP
ncbi:DUF6194 family protein [Nocardia sp. NPDC005366]|uniref:DUF6194 family protein n=1 Tax=Nocardia sp. NPDC005366 TaxID=3156878 RepID=UPI0033B91C51